MTSMEKFALSMLEGAPGIKNNPNAQQMIDVIRSGDARQGEMIARNLCNSYNMSPEEAVSKARGFFHI